MILERPFALVIFPACALATAIVLGSLSISAPQDFNFEKSELQELARIIKNDGRVEMSRFHTYSSSRLRKGGKLDIPVYHMDKVIVQARSKTRLEFLDGYEIEFLPYSRFVLEKWDAENNSGPIYINLLNGSFRMVKKGRRGSIFIVKNNNIFVPELKPKVEARKLFVIRTQFQPASDIAKAQPMSAKQVADSKSETPKETAQEPEKLEDVELKPTAPSADKQEVAEEKASMLATLSNSYIDEVISRNKDQLEKCQSHAVRSKKNAKGELVLGFSIAPRGKMEEVTVIQSSLSNKELEDCVADVFERTRFKAFEGSKIVRSYPLIFD